MSITESSSQYNHLEKMSVRELLVGINHEDKTIPQAVEKVWNVSKVKQTLDTAIPETRERLLRGEISIHRAWTWRTLSAKRQRDALWEHLHHGAIKKTVGRLITAHTEAAAPTRSVDVATIVLGGLATYDPSDITVAVAEVPGRAVVVTRACYEELLEKNTR